MRYPKTTAVFVLKTSHYPTPKHNSLHFQKVTCTEASLKHLKNNSVTCEPCRAALPGSVLPEGEKGPWEQLICYEDGCKKGLFCTTDTEQYSRIWGSQNWRGTSSSALASPAWRPAGPCPQSASHQFRFQCRAHPKCQLLLPASLSFPNSICNP